MLQLYDKNKNKIKGLTKYKDYCIESVLKTGDKTLSFLYPSKFIDGIVEEGYIRNKTDEFVIKEMADRGDWTSIKAQMNVEDLEGKAWEHFNTTEQTIENCLNLACAGTGWTVQVNNVSKKRTLKKTNCSSWDFIQEAKKIYRVEIEFDTLNKVVKVYEKLGHDKGVYFSDEINLKALDIESNSYDFYTKIIAIGKENIKVEVENFQYSNKVKTLIWKDERYTVLENLREDATAKLQELSKPRKSYSADVIDLAKLNSKYKNILDYKLGDTITLISKDKKIREKQRIVKIVEYPDEPERNSCEIANSTLDFIDIQKEFQDTADTVNNITEDNGTISEEAIKVAVKNLTIDKADINSLNAAVARIGTLEATKANITELNAVNAKITNLQANKAEITDLIAGNIKFDVATGGTLDLQTLLSKFVTGENGQFLNLTTDNVTISNALIKDIIAKNISVGDLKAGNIDSNRFNIVGTDGNLLIKDNTIQIKDSTRIRVQIGKDASGDYSMYVWDKQGNLMFDALGLKSSAIKDKIIRDDMVADNANINGSKLNISSLITEVNKDNTQTLKASRISFDSTGQSLEVSFNSLKSNVDNMEIGGRNLQGNADFNKPLSGTWRYDAQFMSINEEILCDGYKSVKILRTNATTTSTRYLYTGGGVIPAKYGEEFTMSFMYYIPEDVLQEIDGTFQAGVWFYKDGNAGAGSTRKNLENEIVKGKWIKVVVTGKAKDVDTKSVAFVIGFDKNCEVYISKPKLERGNKATDFTVAPEDVEEKIESNTTAITVAQGQISGLISENTIIKGDITTISNKYTSLKATVDGINTTVASHTSFIGALNSNVSTIQSSITQLNNKIDLKVESTEVNTIVNNAVNNIQIGGRNLALGTSSEYSTPFTNFDGGVNRTITLGKVLTDGLSIGDTMSVKLVYKYDNVVPTTGKTATCWIQGYGTSTGWGPGFFEPSPRFNPTGSGEYEFIYRITINEEHLKNKFWTTSIRHDNILSGSVQWKMFKVENGNKSTDWSQAPEDVGQAISTVDTKLTTTNNKVASIEANLSSITQRVSSTESTVSTINGNVTNLTSRVSTAESKLTATSLTTTISSAINAGTSSITTTQFVMDKTGFTVKNGAIKIQNKAGTNVMTSDTNGNLTITGTFVNKNWNNVDAIKIQDSNIYFYDWERNGRELGLIYSSQLSDYPNVRGFSLAHNNEGYMTLGYKTSTGYNSYIVFDKYAKNPAYPAPIRVLESAVFQSAVNMQERVYIPQKICFESAYNARTPQIFKNTSDSRNILVAQISVSAVNDGFTVLSHTGGELFSVLAGQSYPIWCRHNTQVSGDFYATGSKNSLQSTDHYGERLINAYETAEYYFGDIGSGVIKDGECIVWIDDIFQECINTDVEYHVFTQVYHGSITRIERYKNYFIVHGEDNTEFSWELKAKRIGYENVRLDQPSIEGYLDNTSIFTEEDLKVDTSEDVLMEELDFNLEEVLMEVI